MLRIAGYCRISVDLEMDRDNTSIENQKSIITDFVNKTFPDASLDFYVDRDRSGYTFEQREDYQILRKKMLNKEYDILIVKDFSRFSRRNSKGLVELEDLRDVGMRIISISDSIDYPTYDDWTAIQFRFLINEMPVTDTSKKIKAVVKRRQEEGKWICSVPYGYIITNNKKMTFEVDEPSAAIVREVFDKYIDGWGYKKIANYLTDQHIPTPRMCEKMRYEAMGEEYKAKFRPEWSIVTIQGILTNDFYIGTLRQHKYMRKKINGADTKLDQSENVVFENNHTPIVDYKTFTLAQELMKQRTKSNYRGIKKYDNPYSGFLICGDCGHPMFSMSRADLAPAYVCGMYQKRGLKGCTSHHIKASMLDTLLKRYIQIVKDNSIGVLDQLQKSINSEQTSSELCDDKSIINVLDAQIEDAKSEIKMLTHQQARDTIKHPERIEIIEEMYSEMIDELLVRVEGLKNQKKLAIEKHNSAVQINKMATTVIEVFDNILSKPTLDKRDIAFIIDKIMVYENRVEVMLKSDINCLLENGHLEECKQALNAGLETTVNFESDIRRHIKRLQIAEFKKNKLGRTRDVNVIYEGDPLEIYTNVDGEVIFKKYSPIGEISSIASQYAEVLSKMGGCPAAICDRDHIIAVSGMQKKEVLERRVSGSLEDLIEQRKSHIYRSYEDNRLMPIEGVNKYAIVCAPIISQGDVNGAVMMLDGDGAEYATPEQTALVQAAAMYFSKQMEE